MMLDETPPGQVPTKTKPSVNPGERLKALGNTDGKQRHDGVLGDCTDENIERTFSQNLIVFFAQSHAHTEHDDAEYDDLSVAFHP